MALCDLEKEIYNCPYSKSAECKGRFNSHPIPGYGPLNPEYLVLGINPALRNGIWRNYKTIETLKQKYFDECINPRYSYGRFLKRLEEAIPQFNINRTVYLTDVARCSVINRQPSSSMLEKCKTLYLNRTIQTLQPKFIIGLGELPTKLVPGSSRIFKGINPARLSLETTTIGLFRHLIQGEPLTLGILQWR